MLNLQQLALLVSSRIHHRRDSHMPLQLLHHNLLLPDLPHHPRLTSAESRINLCSKQVMMFLHKMEHTPKLIPVIHLYSTLYSFVVFLLQGATRKHVQFSRVICLCKEGLDYVLICYKIVRPFCAFRELVFYLLFSHAIYFRKPHLFSWWSKVDNRFLAL